MSWQHTIRVVCFFIMVNGAIVVLRIDRVGVVLGADHIETAQEADKLAEAAQPVQFPLPVVPKFADDVRVRVEDEELSLSKAVRLAASDPQLSEYRRLRATHGATATGQLSLARWCRRRGLVAEERLHWRILLAFQPVQPEAIRRLGLRRYRGDLLTPDEITEAKNLVEIFHAEGTFAKRKFPAVGNFTSKGDVGHLRSKTPPT